MRIPLDLICRVSDGGEKKGDDVKLTGGAFIAALFTWVLLPAGASFAGEADVVQVKAEGSRGGNWSFSVTVRHEDEGWDHYADRWEVLGPEGDVLGVRVLLHPHVEEQPFTRDLSGVRIPAGVSKVKIRARDSVHGYGGKEMEGTLPGN